LSAKIVFELYVYASISNESCRREPKNALSSSEILF
jgi:hypothetical protein